MHQYPLNRSRYLARAALLAAVFLLGTLLGLPPAAPVLAACGVTTVSNEAELNAAIVDFNDEAGSCDFTIEFDSDIILTADVTSISNSNPDASLLIDGAGFTLDGDDSSTTFHIANSPDVAIENLTITGSNWNAIGGEYSGLRVERSTFRGNDSDAIDLASSDVVVVDSTIMDNGGAALDIYNTPSTVTIINSTLTGNRDGIYLWEATATLNHVTFFANGGSVIINYSDAKIYNSILADTTFADCYFYGGTLDIQYTLVETDSPYEPCGVTDGVDGNIVGQDPQLGILGAYGGPTLTIPPLALSGSVTATSPVIDAGNNALSLDENNAALGSDQRGQTRQLNGTVDMGAFEGTDGIVCPGFAATAGDEMALNEAIICFNSAIAAGDYIIEFTADIALSFTPRQISNDDTGISLLIDGAGQALEGSGLPRMISIDQTHEITIDRLTVSGSSRDGIEAYQSNLRVSRSTVIDNNWNGIYAREGNLVVTGSTLMGNGDSGINANDILTPQGVTIINSTITGNQGNGVYLFNTPVLLTNVTVYQNDGGVYFSDSPDATINNSILAENGEDCISYQSSLVVNYSFIGADSVFDPCGVTDGADGNIVGGSPLLGVLGDYGGPTRTLPLLTVSGGVTATSPAVNAGSNALDVDENNAQLAFDQRGAGFPRVVNTTVDMGAFEGTVSITCPAFPVQVSNEAGLNIAIFCYNVSTTPGTYTIELMADIDLTTATPFIDNANAGVSLVIDGNGRTLDAQGLISVRPLSVAAGTTVTVNDATLTGGNVYENGGGVLNEGDLTLNNVEVVDNRVENDGGGIANSFDAMLTLNHSVVDGNLAVEPDGDGGGIANEGTMHINDSDVTNNTADGDFGVYGGGIWNESLLTIHRSTIAGNTVTAFEEGYGGGIVNDAVLIIRDSTISGNRLMGEDDFYGGGIFSEPDWDNVIDDGHGTQLTIINSTISGNLIESEQDGFGAGLLAADAWQDCCTEIPAPVTIINTTIAGNSLNAVDEFVGGGAFFISSIDGDLQVSIHNSILADNFVNGSADSDCAIGVGTISFNSRHSLYSQEDDGACELAAANPDGDGNIVGVNPNLGPLANNGGPTRTHLPGGGSDAIDKGDNALALDEEGDPLAADQRGYTPRAFPTTVDMGAVEVGAQGPVSDSAIYMSAKVAGTTGDGVQFGSEDILKWDGTEWSRWFDGSAAGLTAAKAVHNLNAIWIEDDAAGRFVASFAQNRRAVPGIVPKVDGTDLVRYDGSAFSFWFDGSDVGLTNKVAEKIDGLHVLDGSESPINGGSCVAYLLVSTQGLARVPKFGGGTLTFRGEDVAGFCATSLGENTAGFWHMVLDGSTQGMKANVTDSISLSDDGQTLYLTTKATFNVDSAAGGHSMVYAYDMTTQTFSGPVFSAPAEGLPQKVDGLQVEGDLP